MLCAAGCWRTCVDVFQATQHLIQKELMVLRGQIIVGLDDLNKQSMLCKHVQASIICCFASLYAHVCIGRGLQSNRGKSGHCH